MNSSMLFLIAMLGAGSFSSEAHADISTAHGGAAGAAACTVAQECTCKIGFVAHCASQQCNCSVDADLRAETKTVERAITSVKSAKSHTQDVSMGGTHAHSGGAQHHQN